MTNSAAITLYQNTTERYLEKGRNGEDVHWQKENIVFQTEWEWAVDCMLAESDQQDPILWYLLGDAYHHGRGVKRDVVNAEKWYLKAAEEEYVKAICALASLLRHPECSRQQHEESVAWYRLAAELGSSNAMIWLGYAYGDGRGVEKNSRHAADWFIKGHELGEANAADLAGRQLMETRELHTEAVKWLRISVANGKEISNYQLALIFENPKSQEYNPKEAFLCWSILAERPSGDVSLTAMLKVARCLINGNGISCDLEAARTWLDRFMARPTTKVYRRKAERLLKTIGDSQF
jgi:TPR repeat protein